MVGLCEGGNEPPDSLKASFSSSNWAVRNEDSNSGIGQSWTAENLLKYHSINFSPYGPPSGQKIRDFPCHGCGRSYRWLKHLIAHQRRECGQEPQLQCPVCPMKTKRKENLKRHVLQVHPNYPNIF
ncbi:hypothetical protein ANN_25150 [Periplaneta americana]|uniref:C2H2-type domain-containing protein n=1 Tax=Periplaneta americana TaxID=6978 RepID=A0ABQ8S0R1_PERAM|nr:hypothetical protein ANN_25150 [Periplaneta americana]